MKYRNGERRAPGEVKYGLLEGEMWTKCVGEKALGPLEIGKGPSDDRLGGVASLRPTLPLEGPIID